MKIRVHDYEEPKFFRGAVENCYSVTRMYSSKELEVGQIHNGCRIVLAEFGEARYQIRGETYQVQAGDVMVIGPVEFYRCQITKAPYQRYSLLVDPAYLETFLMDEDLRKIFVTPGVKQFEKHMKHLDPASYERLRELLIRLKREAEITDAFQIQMQHLLLTELAVFLFRETKQEQCYGVITAADARMRDVRAYIDMHFRERIGLEDLGKQFYLHPSTISKEFKRYCGCNVNRYINSVRVCEAARLLEQGEDRIFQVGVQSGFESENTFLRQFGRVMGMSPLRYRKAVKQWASLAREPWTDSSATARSEIRKEEYELQT